MRDEDKTKEQLIAELQEARERAAFLEEVLDTIDLTVQVLEPSGIIKYTNRAGLEAAGFTREQVEGKLIWDFVPPQEVEDRKRVAEEHSKMADGTRVSGMVSIVDAHGRTLFFETSTTKSFESNIKGFVACVREITDRIEAESQRREAQRAVEAIFESVDEAIMVHDGLGHIVHCNTRLLDFAGIPKSFNQQMSILELYSPEFRAGPELATADHYYRPDDETTDLHDIWQDVLNGNDRTFEGKGLKSGSDESFDAEIVLTKVRIKEQDHILAVIRDVTARKRAEQEIRNALHEKEAMLRELHHRVKNNFAVISSLLNLQKTRVKDESILAVLNETAFRIRCMGMVHEKLHQSESLKELSVRDYLNGLLANLRQAYGGTHPGIALHAAVEDVSFGVDKAIPVGFLTSELVSNAYKHAFPEGRAGTIHVELRPAGDSSYELLVADDGVGMPRDLDIKRLPSLGMDLVQTFSQQLDGKLNISNGTGTTVRIEFAV